MNQMTSEFLAEAPLHSALAICGAGGYMFMKHTKDIMARRVQSTHAAKLSTDVDEPEQPEFNDEQSHEASVETEAQAQDTKATPEVSDRVAKLMAKKAARKAKKALERLQEETCEAVAVEQPVVEEAVEELPPCTVEVSKLSAKCCDLAELSTADEGMALASHAEETVDDMETEAEMETVLDYLVQEHSPSPDASLQTASAWPEQPFVAPAWSHASHYSQKWQRSAPCNDAWMTPFENTIRSREEAERVYQQVYEACAAAEAASRLQCEPVLVSGQQLYTDGERFFMLACIDETKGTQSLVVDAQDPLHAEFAKDIQAGLVPLPASQQV